jgi:hypothetical protein
MGRLGREAPRPRIALPLRTMRHLAARASWTVLSLTALSTLALAALLLLFVAVREPLALRWFPFALITQVLLEAASWTVLIAAPLGLAWTLDQLRQDGSLLAARQLPSPWTLQLAALLLPGLCATVVGARLVHETLPGQRLELRNRALPIADLTANERREALPELLERHGQFAWRYEEAEGEQLKDVRLLQLNTSRGLLALRAESATQRIVDGELSLSFGRGTAYWGEDPQYVEFEELDFSLPLQSRAPLRITPAELVGSAALTQLGERLLARAAREDPRDESIAERRARYARESWQRNGRVVGAMLGLLAALLLLARTSEADTARRVLAYVLALSAPLLTPALAATIARGL